MKSANYPHTTQNPNLTNAIVTAMVSEPGPTPSGTTGTCYKWHVVKDGGYCYPIEQQQGISMKQLMGWNPSCKADCNNLIQGDAWVTLTFTKQPWASHNISQSAPWRSFFWMKEVAVENSVLAGVQKHRTSSRHMGESKSDEPFHGWSTMYGNLSIRLCRSIPFSVVSKKAVAVLKTLRL